MASQNDYAIQSTLHADDFSSGFDRWHHEGAGSIQSNESGDAMLLHCAGSQQGREGCMAFFRPNLPDCVMYEYDMKVLSQGGLVINYLAIRGLNGEDMIEDADKLEPRTGIMGNYFGKKWGLQSYHVSVSRFNDKGEHTGTCNMRRNPGLLMVAHGMDRVTTIGREYHIQVVKDKGHVSLYVDNEISFGFVDRDESRYPIPDTGKFGFRLIGSDVKAEIRNFKIHQLEPNPSIWGNKEDFQGF